MNICLDTRNREQFFRTKCADLPVNTVFSFEAYTFMKVEHGFLSIDEKGRFHAISAELENYFRNKHASVVYGFLTVLWCG